MITKDAKDELINYLNNKITVACFQLNELQMIASKKGLLTMQEKIAQTKKTLLKFSNTFSDKIKALADESNERR